MVVCSCDDSETFGLEQGMISEAACGTPTGTRAWLSGACVKRYHCLGYEMQRAIVD